MEKNSNRKNVGSPSQIFTEKEISLADLMAVTDALTGLGNSKYVEKVLNELPKDAQGQFWVVDLDGFRKIQNEKGVLFADEVLCDVARVLCQSFEEEPIISRNIEDEFIVLTLGGQSTKQIEDLALQIKQEIQDLYKGDCIDCTITASIGIALIPEQGSNLTELLEMAEKAVAHVKSEGGNGYALFQSSYMDRHLPKRLNLVGRREELFEMLPKESATEYYFRFLTDTKDSKSAIGLMMKRTPDFYGVDHCCLFLADEDTHSLQCRYEGRKNQDFCFNGQSISFSERGWKNHLERLTSMEPCQLVDRLFFGKGYLTETFSVLPAKATLMQAIIYAEGIYIGELFLISYLGQKIWTEEGKKNLDAFAKVLGYYLLVQKEKQAYAGRKKSKEGIDALTGLYTLETFLDVAEEMVQGSEDSFSVLYLDIGNFKAINRDCGYDFGDFVLQECAKFLKNAIPAAVCVGRIYGDKFAVLCRRDLRETMEQVQEQIYHVNCLLQNRIRQLSKGENILVHTGLYNIPKGVEMSAALSRSKMAKNIAKQQWSNKLVIYEEWMTDSVQRNYELIAKVDEAIANHEFVVFLQPKVDSETMQVIGAEALVRWRKADGTMVFPDEFIPIFEKNGRIIDVDYYVYEEVFRYLRKRLDEGKPVVPISMNVSRVHLRSGNFMDKINELLEKYQVPCEYLEFELTENVYVEKLQEALPFIEDIRKKKIKVSIDDFGSGYSSLNVISSIPLDVLKLDKAFMKRGAELTQKDRAVITHLVELAKDIELEVLCEGVETQIQADFVKAIGCTAWQGYCFAKPMAMEDFDRCLDSYM